MVIRNSVILEFLSHHYIIHFYKYIEEYSNQTEYSGGLYYNNMDTNVKL
jgi:hypothetical protein